MPTFSLKVIRQPKFFWGILFVVMLLGILAAGVTQGSDFKVFRLAGERLINGESIYQGSDDYMPYKYHPVWAVLFSMISLLPFALTNVLFNLLNLTGWYFASKQWAKWLGYRFDFSAVSILLLLSLNAISAEIGFGQVNGLLFLGLTTIFKLLESDKDQGIQAGLICALMISVKLNYGLILIYALARNWKSILGLLVGVLGLHAVTAIAYQDLLALDTYKTWIRILLNNSNYQFDVFESQGMLRLCYNLIGPKFAGILWLTFLAFFIILGLYFTVFKISRARIQNENSRALWLGMFWISTNAFFSPLSWWYHVLFLYPIVFFFLKLKTKNTLRYVALFAITVYGFFSYNTLGESLNFQFKDKMGFLFVSLIVYLIYTVWLLSVDSLPSLNGNQIRE